MNNFSRMAMALRHVGRLPEVFRCMSEVENWWDVTSAYVGVPRQRPPFEVRFRDGMRHRIQEFYDLETLWQIYFHHVYVVRPSDRVIVDAGANIGLFASYAGRRSPTAQIVCVEPFPTTYVRLLETLRANQLADRVRCRNEALDSKDGVAAMSAGVEATPIHHLTASGGANKVRVRTVSLARLFEDTNIETVDLLKMDIEGSEFDVLLTTPMHVLQRVRRINVEYHKPPVGACGGKQELIAHVESSGARIVHASSHGLYGMLHFERLS